MAKRSLRRNRPALAEALTGRITALARLDTIPGVARRTAEIIVAEKAAQRLSPSWRCRSGSPG